MKRVLFVCLGNICRSPMAEAVFRNYLQESELEHTVQVNSAAVSRWEVGSPPHKGTQEILKEQCISFAGIYATQITASDFFTYDWIIGMDEENLSDLKHIAPKGTEDKIHLFLSVVPELGDKEVPDPYYTGDFEKTYELVNKGCQKWLDIINNEA